MHFIAPNKAIYFFVASEVIFGGHRLLGFLVVHASENRPLGINR
jgi:hypothetical protein